MVERWWSGKERSFPAPPRLNQLLVFADSGALRAAYLVDVPEQGDPAFDPSGLPEGGVPSFAMVLELTQAGTWRQLARASTKAEAEGAPGLSVVNQHLKPRAGTVSLEDLLQRVTCREQDCDPEGQGTKIPPGRREELGFGPEAEVGYIGGAIFSIVTGDSPHAVPPVIHLRTGRVLLEAGYGQISLSAREGLLLITNEYTGGHPRVYSAEGKLLFESPKATMATWLPFPLSAARN